MRATFSRVQKFNPELIPPTGAVPFGVTPWGAQLYRMVIPKSRGVPDIDPATGQQRWRKNQMTGEPLYPVNKPELYDETRIFYLRSGGNGNIQIRDWAPPSAEAVARAQKSQRVAEMNDKMAEALVESGMDPAELLAILKSRGATTTATNAVTTEASAPTSTGSFPEMYAPGRWKLSNGMTMQGKKVEAEEAEADVRTARANANATPEG